MIIDTDAIRDAVNAHMVERCDAIDQNVKSDRQAMAMFTRLEQQQAEIDEQLEKAEYLASIWCPEEP